MRLSDRLDKIEQQQVGSVPYHDRAVAQERLACSAAYKIAKHIADHIGRPLSVAQPPQPDNRAVEKISAAELEEAREKLTRGLSRFSVAEVFAQCAQVYQRHSH